jgi:epoxyqueuosine reductase
MLYKQFGQSSERGITVTLDKGAQIIDRAQAMGAAMAGIASVELLKRSPSHEALKRLRLDDFDEVNWPPKARSVLVIALSHPPEKPELDWSDASGNTPGNRRLTRINRDLSVWIERRLGIINHPLLYFVQEGGIYLKDAAVLAGFGCIGKNNILITPDLGPRVRLRAMLLEDELTPTGPISFDPCDGCEEPCRQACPQNAFDGAVFSSVETGLSALPGRDGSYSRPRCNTQMGNDFDDAGLTVVEGYMSELHQSSVEMEGASQSGEGIKWCRRCELACPIGL